MLYDSTRLYHLASRHQRLLRNLGPAIPKHGNPGLLLERHELSVLAAMLTSSSGHRASPLSLACLLRHLLEKVRGFFFLDRTSAKAQAVRFRI